ncbi:hypothetical protein EDD86DRAFT_191224 [Gorgonomyces haynaldii]|nr:hypothetical protein EDD86DRAFT_191224 [Gorgonomyces haynaldii]
MSLKRVLNHSPRVRDAEGLEPLLPVSSTVGFQPLQSGVAPQPYRPQKPEAQQRQPKRTTKTSQKLTLFPEGIETQEEIEEEIPHPTTRTQKQQWVSKLERKWLPRVTAYCTANSYKMEQLMEHLRKKNPVHRTSPKRFDEVIYTPYTLGEVSPTEPIVPDLIELPPQTSSNIENVGLFLDQNIDASGNAIPGTIKYEDLAKRIAPIGEILYFDYGVVVMWGYTEQEEQRLLDELGFYEDEPLESKDMETEQFYFHYNTYYQPRIYNDIITLKNPANFMLKITISHAIAQSVKLTLFENKVEETIDDTKHIPQIMAEDGKINMSRTAINQKIGQLFIMRINVNLVSNVLDTPELFWSEPAIEPLYKAIRGYLEIPQRVELLNQRVGVISDLLDMLKEHLNSSHGEQLEWIVIVLIAFEIIIGIITITVDLSGYYHEINKP